jgi:hypothetical protein
MRYERESSKIQIKADLEKKPMLPLKGSSKGMEWL